MIWKIIALALIVNVIAVLIFGLFMKVGSGKPIPNWREFLPWRLIREIENNHDVSVFFPIMTLGAEVGAFLICAAIALAVYLA